MRSSESGNVLFLILIAVALFAALSFAVTHSTRNSGSNMDRENRIISGSRIWQYTAQLRTAIVSLQINDALNLEDISFHASQWGHNNYQHGVPQPDRNKIFHVDGAGVPWQAPDPDWLDSTQSAQPNYGEWLFLGSTCIPEIGTGSDGTCDSDPDQLELMAVLPYVTLNYCQMINVRFGITDSTSDAPPQDQGDAWPAASPEYVGVFGNAEVLQDAGGLLDAYPTGCFEGGGNPPAGTYHFYTALIER